MPILGSKLARREGFEVPKDAEPYVGGGRGTRRGALLLRLLLWGNEHKILSANEVKYLKPTGNNEDKNTYPSKLSSKAALYCEGISINAARANAVSFREGGMFFDIISVKFTN